MTDTTHLGPFELGDQIGAGGMGAVYRAHHVETGGVVALKVWLAEAARTPQKRLEFRREVQAMAQLYHPAIAGVVDYGEIDPVAAE